MNSGFKYFPEKLYSKTVKMLNITAMAFGMSKPSEIFYSIKDGNWNDVSIWETVSGRPGKLPTANDDVYIRNSVAANVPCSMNNLFVTESGVYYSSVSNITHSIFGNVKCKGFINLNPFTATINIYGNENYIDNFSSATFSTIAYVGAKGQYIMPLNYGGLTISNGGENFIYGTTNIAGTLTTASRITLQTNLSVLGAFNCFASIFELSNFDFSVTGLSRNTAGSTLSKNGTGNILFIGSYEGLNSVLNLSGNPNVEIRANLNLNGVTFTSGTGNWNYTTNTKTASFSGTYLFYNPISIVGVIDVSILSNTTPYAGGMGVLNSINGTVAGSKLINKGAIYFYSAGIPFMTTGILDILSFANVIAYPFSGNFALPFTSYYNVYIDSPGIKTLSGNTTLLGTMEIGAGVNEFDVEANNFSAGGLVTNRSTLKKSSSTGSLTFIGNLLNIGNSIINFSANPSVEFRGGINYTSVTYVFNTGNNRFTFTTNNQTIPSGFWNTSCEFLISGAIKLTITAPLFQLSNSLNGNNAASTFENRGAFLYSHSTAPMVTGILDCNAAANTFKYSLNGNQDVKGGTYRTLEFAVSGVKRLLGNVVVNVTAGGSWSITGTATIDYNGFTITTI